MFRLRCNSGATCLQGVGRTHSRCLVLLLLICAWSPSIDAGRVSRRDAHKAGSRLHSSLRREQHSNEESSSHSEEASASSLVQVSYQLQSTAQAMLDFTFRLFNPMIDFAMRRFVSDPSRTDHKRNATVTVKDAIAEHQMVYLQQNVSAYQVLMALGGGTGASMGTGNSATDHEILQRMHYQDKAVMLLILMVYMVALAMSARITYRHASNNSPITFYSDPRFHSFAMEGNELDHFLDTFNQVPRDVVLQVVGYLPVAQESEDSVHWQGKNYRVAFTFSLDLSPWVVRESSIDNGTNPTHNLQDGTLQGDYDNLRHMLTNDKNDLSYVQVRKAVSWVGFEELATNIKHQIRQQGFNGLISVHRTENEEVRVYKNLPWANFLHARATRVLCALSMFGWLFYWPYMWARCRSVKVRSHFRIDISIADYWRLIENQLSPEGFHDDSAFASDLALH